MIAHSFVCHHLINSAIVPTSRYSIAAAARWLCSSRDYRPNRATQASDTAHNPAAAWFDFKPVFN
jgi:hypothetical protein